jgi:hypothetical protein
MASITEHEARSALADIANVNRRGLTLKGYRYAAPILMVWGVIWCLGYLGMARLSPALWGWLWLALDTLGFGATLILTARASAEGLGENQGARGQAVRTSLGMAAAVVFILSIVAVFPKTDLLPYLALPGLFVGFIYTILGIFMAPRYAWIGVAMFAATLLGYYAWPARLAEWLAVVGGGGLFLSGLWLRRA